MPNVLAGCQNLAKTSSVVRIKRVTVRIGSADGAKVIKNVRQYSRRRSSDEEIGQITIGHTGSGMGVCAISRKRGCHYSTISKMQKARSH